MPIRWPWESDKAYARRLKAWELKQVEKTKRVQAVQGARSDIADAKSEGGYWSAESVAARQGTVQTAIGAGLTAAEGVAQAFGYSVDLDGSSNSSSRAAASAPLAVASPASSTSTFGGLDQQTVMILAVVAIGGVLLLSRK